MGVLTASVLAQAFWLVFDPYVLWVIFASAIFGLFVGAVPGLTATMATDNSLWDFVALC